MESNENKTTIQETLYTLYLHTCLANNKVYVGVTSQDANMRWLDGDGYKSNFELYTDIRQYGWEKGFNHKIVNDNLSWEKAKEAERYFIEMFDATNPEKGYNHDKGGKYGGHKDRNINVGEKIKLLRKTKNLTQQEVADSINISRATIGSWETGRRIPYLDDLKKLGDLFGVGIAYFEEDVKQSNASTQILNRIVEFFNSSDISIDEKIELFNNIVSIYTHFILDKN